MQRAPRRSRRGLTLIEVMIAFAISMIVLIGVFSLATNQVRVLGFTRNRIDMDHSASASLARLVEDLRIAGVGGAYAEDGSFSGLMRGNFTVPGGAVFTANDFTVALASG